MYLNRPGPILQHGYIVIVRLLGMHDNYLRDSTTGFNGKIMSEVWYVSLTKLLLKWVCTKETICYAVIKEKMDKDLDEISKIAGGLKGKLEALDRAVCGIVLTCEPFCATNCHFVSLSCSLFVNCSLHYLHKWCNFDSIYVSMGVSLTRFSFLFCWLFGRMLRTATLKVVMKGQALIGHGWL